MNKKIIKYSFRGYINTIALACIFFCLAGAASAQVLNLYDAVNKTTAYYPLLQQRQAEVAAVKAHVTTVNGYRLPSLKLLGEASAGTANSLDGPYFSMGIIPSTSGSINTTEKTNIALGDVAVSYMDWQFYTFGYYNAQTKEAKAQLASTQAVYNADRYLLTGNVVSLYLDLLKKYRLLLIQKENVDRVATIFNAIKATVLSGLKPGVDSATASAEYSRARIAFIQAQNDYKDDQISMSSFTGLDTALIRPDTSVFDPAFMEQIYLFQPRDSISLSHPLLDIYQKQYEQQLASLHTISKKYLPRLSVEGAGWVRSSSISPTEVYSSSSDLANAMLYSRSNYLFGLTLSYDLFDLKHRNDEMVEGHYRVKAQAAAMQNEQLDLNRMLQQTNSAYSSTIQKLNELPFELRSSQEAYGQQMALYRSGLNTLIDVTNALYVLNQTETDYILAQGDLMQLLYMKAGLSNQLDTFLQNFKK
jgi:adhesin transport system outer membrane protein